MKYGHRVGGRESAEYRAWIAMRIRCNNPKDQHYKRYGARGIKVCVRWEKFDNFIADMGKRPIGTSLERIDNSKGYNPDNCRWATAQEQANNRSSNVRILYRGEDYTMAQWSKKLGLNIHALKKRFQAGWTIERALCTPIKSHKNNIA